MAETTDGEAVRIDLDDPETDRRIVQSRDPNSASLSVNIPAYSRRKLGIEQGDHVVLKPTDDGRLVVEPLEV
jgi:AbrB family looped-hinge helix DNA binding protein